MSVPYWDYRTLDWMYAHPGYKLKSSQHLLHPSRCAQDDRSLTVLIDGDDPFRPGIPDHTIDLVFQEMERLPGLQFFIVTQHETTAKYIIRRRSEAQVAHAKKWLRHKDPDRRTCPAALAAIQLAKEPYLPNLKVLVEHWFRAPSASVRLSG